MAKRVAKFYKVSFEQFKKDFLDCYTISDMVKYNLLPEIVNESTIESTIKKIYDSIDLPRRGSKDSAGYDFFTPFTVNLESGQTIKFPTGIRCRIDSDWVLKIYPRSGLGFKYRAQLDNTVGIIDGDYFYTDNEGHIMAKITNDSKTPKIASFNAGKGFMQGIFSEYGITEDDDVDAVRVGGFGSTGM